MNAHGSMNATSTTRIVTNPDNGFIMIKTYAFEGASQKITQFYVNSSIQPTELTSSFNNYFLAAVKN